MKTILDLTAAVLGALLSWLLAAGSAELPLDMVINGIHPKVSPFELMQDDDMKDVRLRDRARFKPSKGSETGLHRRFQFRSRKDGGEARLCHGRQIVGDGTAWVRVAVDSTKGLSTPTEAEGSPGTGFYLGCPPDPDRESARPASPQLEAVWNASINGFTVQATDRGVPVGISIDFPGMKELFLIGTRSGDELTLQAAEPTGDGHTGFGVRQTVWSQSGMPAGPYSLELGVRNLGKGGRIFATQLTIRVVPGQAASTGAHETTLGELLVDGLLDVDVVDTMLFFPSPHDFPTIVASLTAAQVDLDAARALIDGAQGGFLPETPTEVISKWLDRAEVGLEKALAKLQKLQDKGATNAKPLKKTVNRAQTGFRIALGQLFGFKTTKLSRLNKAVDLD